MCHVSGSHVFGNSAGDETSKNAFFCDLTTISSSRPSEEGGGTRIELESLVRWCLQWLVPVQPGSSRRERERERELFRVGGWWVPRMMGVAHPLSGGWKKKTLA